MIPSGARVWIAMGHTEIRKGMQGLALLVHHGLTGNPPGSDLFVFRGRAGSLVKLIWHDGIGMSLYAKWLEKGQFVWPSAMDGMVSLTNSQLACLLDGIDWRNSQYSWRPQSAGKKRRLPFQRSILRVIRAGFCDSIAVMGAAVSPLPDDIEALKALLASASQRANEAEAKLANANARESATAAVIAHLKLQIAKLRREQYGASAERTRRLLN